jgi:prepilin-type N-terminal cleavage/methylation domain-containing protein/prepilin-type processing-associated H-X9-DG protein
MNRQVMIFGAGLDRRRLGFTLIELLVVILIIALLIGILLPVLSKAKDASKQSKCLSSVRQIGLGLEAFANDHRDLYPIAGSVVVWDGPADPITGQLSWMQQTAPYIDVEKFWSGCPTYPEDSPYHYFLGNRAAWIAWGKFASIYRPSLRYTSAYVLAGDVNRHFNFTDADKDDYTQECADWDIASDPALWYPHHDGGLNIFFADGHAALYKAFDPGKMTYRYDRMSAWN